MPVSYSGVDLINIKFEIAEGQALFKLSDQENKNSITIDYIPNLEDSFNVEDYELTLFDNLYLNAENDVFQIIERNGKIRIGWMFPLSNLESNENSFAENKFFNRYKFVAFQHLLAAREKSIVLDVNLTEFKISDLYPNNPILLVISKSSKAEIENFELEDYIPSLSKFGYYRQNEYPCGIKLKPKEDFCFTFRGSEKLNVSKANIRITEDRFFVDLFYKHLKYLDHHLIRFHLLYQIIEYILTQRFDKVFANLILSYNESTIIKNDFIEKINELGKERINIKRVIESIKNKPKDFDIVSIERDCKMLLEAHKKRIKNSLGDLIYDTRNLIVHNYRSIEPDEIELIEAITHQLELVTINIIEQYAAEETVEL